MKKLLLPFLVVTAIALLASCGNSKEADGGSAKVEKKVINISTKFVDDEQTAISLKKVVEQVNEKSDSIELQLFSSGVLPIGKDGMEQVVAGSDWILVDGVNFLGDYVPDYNAITGPFLYSSFDEYFAMTQTSLVKELNQKIEKEYGVKVMSLDWVFGFRSMMTNKPIKVPADMEGLNIRVPTSQLYTYTIEAMGGNPVAMPYPDTYAALQQGVIDGVEGSIMTYYGTQQYENVKEYSLTNHLLGVSAVTISTKLWDSLSEKDQVILTEAFQMGREDNLAETLKAEGEFVELLKAQGVHFNDVDGQAFLAAAAPVYTRFPQWTPGIYDRILAELEGIKAAN